MLLFEDGCRGRVVLRTLGKAVHKSTRAIATHRTFNDSNTERSIHTILLDYLFVLEKQSKHTPLFFLVVSDLAPPPLTPQPPQNKRAIQSAFDRSTIIDT
jgi:hypothetical protein